ncbi:MAG: MG2 domain-containing protein [Planctomycetota bacterium]|nr:MG2 domain-containing protein [Planctomycetota bacterium]
MKSSEGIAQWQKEIEAAKADGAVLTKPLPPKAKTQKLFEEAIADLQQLVKKYPNTEQASRAAFTIGTTREDQLGQLAESLEAYKQVTGQYAGQAKQRIDNLTAKQLQVVTERKFQTDEKPRVRITTRNIEKVSVKMHRIDMVDYFRKMHLATGVESLDIALIDPDKTWEHDVSGFKEYLSLSNEVDIPVEGPGVTAVTISGEELEATTMVVVSDIDIIVKSSRNELFAFAQNSRTGKPQSGISLLISDGEKVFAEDVTGEDGILQKSFEELKSIADLRVFSVHEGHAASTVSSLAGLEFAVGLAPKGYLYVDRPAYRAGQLVNVRGIVRWVSEDRYTFKPGEKYQLDVYDGRGRIVHSRKVALSKFGTVADNFELPDSTPEGIGRIVLHQPGGTQSYETVFRVHQYQLQSVQLEVDVPKQVYYRGEIAVTLKTTLGNKTTSTQSELDSPRPGVHELSFPVELAGDLAEFELTIKSGKLEDTVTQAVPIRPYGLPVVATTSGTAAQSTIVFVEHEGQTAVEDSHLELFIGPSIDRTLLEGVLGSSIGNYGGGIERSISDVLGGVSLLKLVSQSRNADSPEVVALTARVNAGISRLVSSQRDDGGWSWSGRTSAGADRYATSRAAWALAVAGRAGFSVPSGTMASAVCSLQTAFTASGTADREGQAILLHGLAEADAADFAWANRLYRERNNLTASGLLHVALTLIRLDRKEMAGDLIELVKLPLEPATANTREQSDSVLKCIPWMRSGVELRALYLLCVEELFPTDKSAAQAADWLMAARRGFRWNPEKANGPAMMALAEWFSKKKFSSEKYRLTIQVNDTNVTTLEIDPAADPTHQISVPAELLVAGKPQKVSLTIDGRGEFSVSIGPTRSPSRRQARWPCWLRARKRKTNTDSLRSSCTCSASGCSRRMNTKPRAGI